MDRKKLLEETELFVLDMDGTFYLDTQILDGSLEFLRQVERLGKRYVFFTNNSSKSRGPILISWRKWTAISAGIRSLHPAM